MICVGKKTAEELSKQDFKAHLIAEEETSEGIVEELKKLSFSQPPFFLWPHSALSRPIIKDFLENSTIPFKECILYDTKPHKMEPIPSFSSIDEIIFTSPSCVDAFLEIFGPLPQNKILTPIGPITKKRLDLLLN